MSTELTFRNDVFVINRKLILRNAYFNGTWANESELRLVKFHYNLPERLPVQESEFMDSGSRGAEGSLPSVPRRWLTKTRTRSRARAKVSEGGFFPSDKEMRRARPQRRRTLFSLGKASLRTPLGAHQRVRQSGRIPLITACRLSTYCACTVALLRC